MTKDSSKLAFALLDFYVKNYRLKYGKDPRINRYRDKWIMNDIIEGIGYDRAKILVEYYFHVTNAGHTLQWFAYNYDRLDEMKEQLDDDKKRRAKMLAETKARMEARESI